MHWAVACYSSSDPVRCIALQSIGQLHMFALSIRTWSYKVPSMPTRVMPASAWSCQSVAWVAWATSMSSVWGSLPAQNFSKATFISLFAPMRGKPA